VTVVDPARGTVTATISVGKRPLDILAINDAIYVSTDDGFTAYGTQQGSVKVINAFNNRITASIPIGPLGFNMASSRTGGKVYVTNALGGSVSAIDKAINTVADIIPVDGNYLGPLVVNSDGTRLYATSGLANGGALTKINTVSLISAQFDVGLVPYALGISPNGTRLYATFNNGQAGGVLRVINVSDLTTIADIPVGHDPISAAVSPDGTRVYVANYRDGTLSVVDVSSSTVTATIPVGSRPTDVALSLDGKFVYVTDSSDNTVRVIRAINNKVVETITVGPNPGAIAVA
jgi:YVTN family beta-propeller protein